MRWVKLAVSLLVIAVLVIGVVSAVNFVKNLLFSTTEMLSNAGSGTVEEPETVWIAPSIAPDDKSWSDQAYDTVYGADDTQTEEPEVEEEEDLEEIPIEHSPEELADTAGDNIVSDTDSTLEPETGFETDSPDGME